MDSNLVIQPVENKKMPVPPEGGFPPAPPPEEVINTDTGAQ